MTGKKTWKLINELRGKKRVPTKPIFKIENEVVHDRRIIANKFNEYFVSLAMNLNKKVENDYGLITEALPTFETYLTKRCENSLYIGDCDTDEIIKIISGFANGKASDIPVRIVKRAAPVLAKILKLLYNNCISEGIFPSCLKTGRISHVFKKGDEQLIENYRPVSILPIFGKIFEKIIYTRMYSFVVAQGILHENQFGFRQSHSTSHALNYAVTKIGEKIKSGESVIGIFIDLSKAFDTIDHQKLLYKLENYGIRGVAGDLVKSYLLNRQQYTETVGEKSKCLKVLFGVPQGSVLGLLLFLLYINDLIQCCKVSNFVLYADDTNIFVCAPTYEEALAKANNVLKSVLEYMMVNKLLINLTKSYYINFTKNMTIYDNCPQLKINDTVIKEVDEIKFLGILLDKKLSFELHVNYLCKKLCCCIGSLKHMRNFIPEKLKINLYHTLFESHLSYGISVWGGIGNAKIDKLLIVQKRCIHMLLGDYDCFKNKFMTCVRVRLFENQKLGNYFFEKEHTKPLFNEHKILTVHNLYVYH